MGWIAEKLKTIVCFFSIYVYPHPIRASSNLNNIKSKIWTNRSKLVLYYVNIKHVCSLWLLYSNEKAYQNWPVCCTDGSWQAFLIRLGLGLGRSFRSLEWMTQYFVLSCVAVRLGLCQITASKEPIFPPPDGRWMNMEYLFASNLS
jgi:hypothetical protein